MLRVIIGVFAVVVLLEEVATSELVKESEGIVVFP